MLVLSRKETEKLLLPTLGVTIEVVRVQGKKVRLGIDAPPDIPILRQELADLKGIDFAPSEESANRKCANLAQAVRMTLDSTASVMNQLHASLEGNAAGQQLVLDAFSQLRKLDRDLNDTLEDKGKTAPHALLIDNDAHERELLASCLRLSGFEVVVAANVEEALSYLSMHSRPDFALIDVSNVEDHVVERLRSSEACSGIRFIGLGENQTGIDRAFDRPINAEQLVDELAREFIVTAV